MIGMVTDVHAAARTFDVRLANGRRLRLPAHYLDSSGVDHGYAVTIHKSQGTTCDHVFVVGPRGLYRQASYVAMSRARHGAHLYATNSDAARIGERHHATGIPLPSEPDRTPEHDLLEALQRSQAKLLASRLRPHLAAIADTAHRHRLDELLARHRHCRRVVADLERAGHRNPTTEQHRLERARTHSRFLHTGGRVRALDWDNVGTVQAVTDVTGTCLVRFDSPDGRVARKVLDWADAKPIDHPDPVELTDDAQDFFALWEKAIGEDTVKWDRLLTEQGVSPAEPVIVAAAIEHRQRQLSHRLAGQQPDWLLWWYGPRPTDPAGAQVWDDEIAAVAGWRDARRLPDHIAGYGPRPEPGSEQRWREHLRRSLDVRHWLYQHQPGITSRPIPKLTAAEVHGRLTELDAMLAGAPPDQTRILDDLRAGTRTPADVDVAIHDALTAQRERADWILEHWPHVIELAELMRLAEEHGPLGHWPIPLSPEAQALYDRLAAISVESPEVRTIGELDDAIIAADPRRRLARLQAEQNDMADRLDRLNRERTTLAGRPDLLAVIDGHRRDLIDQYRQHEREIRHARSGITLQGWGSSADRQLHAARSRRASHLAHEAITKRHEWMIEAVRIWTKNHARQGGAVDELHRLVTDIAAHRERHSVTGAEPIAPGLLDEHSCALGQRLHGVSPTARPAAQIASTGLAL